MRVFTGDNSYDCALNHCCGVSELGNFRNDDSINSQWENPKDWPKIKDVKTRGCGVFVSTILPSQWRVYRQLIKYHTLVSRSGPYKNKGPDASSEGRDKGVYLCVFKFGKDK